MHKFLKIQNIRSGVIFFKKDLLWCYIQRRRKRFILEKTLHLKNDGISVEKRFHNSQHYYYIKQLDNYSHKPQYFDLLICCQLSGQDGAIPASCVSQEKNSQKPYNKFFIDQACSVKMARYWLCSLFACLWTSTPRSISTQKKDLANIQPP